MLTESGAGEEGRGVLPTSEAATQEAQRQAMVGTAWAELIRQVEALRVAGYRVRGVNLRGPWSGNVDLLIVITADGPTGPVVAFHGGENISTIWDRLARRMKSGGLTWKADQYAE